MFSNFVYHIEEELQSNAYPGRGIILAAHPTIRRT